MQSFDEIASGCFHWNAEFQPLLKAADLVKIVLAALSSQL
jgi:hypothetical protein